MHRKSFFATCISLLAVTWFGLHAVAAEDLPAANWYAVLNTQLSDQLVWINAQGVQATINRPKVPNEKQGPQGGHDIRISPDGRYGVITAVMNDGRNSINFYDFQTGTFIKGHIAQLNETIALGGMSVFTPSLSGVAAGFYTLQDNGVTDWRIIHFNYQTGDAVMVLQKSDNKVPALPIGLGAFPQLLYADGNAYTFAMIPYAVGGSTELTAFEWSLQSNLVSGPHSVSSELDADATGALFEARYEVALPQFEGAFEGPIPIQNVLTQRSSLEDMPQTYLNNTDGSLFSPRWARDGDWYAYRVATPTDGDYWVIHNLETGEEHSYIGLSPTELYGTTDGALLSYEGDTILHTTDISDANAPLLYEAAQNDSARIVYVTPQGSSFTLPSVADGGVVVNPPTNIPAAQLLADPNCPGAPQPQLALGVPSRVTFTDGAALRVRQEPNGTVITELAEGTEFAITEGPVCANNYNWWKMSMPIQGGALTGWVAEGNMELYFVEIWYIDAVGPVVTPTLPPAVAVTPLVLIPIPTKPLVLIPIPTKPLVLIPIPTKPLVIINPGFIVDGNCSSAVAQYLSVGANVITQLDGTLAMRDTPTAEFPTAQVASGVTGKITDGPLCHGGFRRWKVEFSSGQTGWVPDSFGNTLYLKKN